MLLAKRDCLDDWPVPFKRHLNCVTRSKEDKVRNPSEIELLFQNIPSGFSHQMHPRSYSSVNSTSCVELDHDAVIRTKWTSACADVERPSFDTVETSVPWC